MICTLVLAAVHCVAADTGTSAPVDSPGAKDILTSSSVLDVVPPIPVFNEFKSLVDIATGPTLLPVLRDSLKVLCLVGAKAVVPVPGFGMVAAITSYPLCVSGKKTHYTVPYHQLQVVLGSLICVPWRQRPPATLEMC